MFPLVAVDIGNSRIKLGLFERSAVTGEFPSPKLSLTIANNASLSAFNSEVPAAALASPWYIASVQRATSAKLVDWLNSQGTQAITLLKASDLPLVVELEHPDRAGIDRLVNAVAVNQLRKSDRAAIVIDLGSAITVDAVSDSGAFLGGAILPGIGMAARALHEFTDLLPLSNMTELNEAPQPVGESTAAALQSGLFWGAVGGMRELCHRFRSRVQSPQIFITGGAAPSVAQFVEDETGERAIYVPHLTLAGIALSTRS